MKKSLVTLLSTLWQKSNANHKLTHLAELNSALYLHTHLYSNARANEAGRLLLFEQKVFSQNGEDGILEEIFRRIGTTNKFFVEFGVGDGLENNTSYLLLKGWSGVWIEGSVEFVERIRTAFAPLMVYDGASVKLAGKLPGRLHVEQAFVTADNIEGLFAKSGVPPEFDLLSIDIDGNDYWVWKAIERYSPRVVVVEYNASLPPAVEWIKAYNPDALWDGTMNFSASLKALEMLGVHKGYTLVGCCFRGVNAFFVRTDLVEQALSVNPHSFCQPFTAEHHYEPPRYFLHYSSGHPPSAEVITQGITDETKHRPQRG